MVRLIVRMTVYQHISLCQNLPIFQPVSVHCSNVHVSNLQSICEYNDYTLTNVLVSDTTLQLIFETQVDCLCSKHKYTVYVPTTDKGLFCPMCQMYYYKSNRFGGILSISGYLRTVVFSCNSPLGVLSRRGLVCNSLDNGGPGVLTTWVASISVGGFGVSPLDGWYDSLVSSRCWRFRRITRPSSNSTSYDRGPDDLMTLPLTGHRH